MNVKQLRARLLELGVETPDTATKKDLEALLAPLEAASQPEGEVVAEGVETPADHIEHTVTEEDVALNPGEDLEVGEKIYIPSVTAVAEDGLVEVTVQTNFKHDGVFYEKLTNARFTPEVAVKLNEQGLVA